MALITIARKQLADTRWSLLLTCLAFFGLCQSTNWSVSRFQFPPPEPAREEEKRAPEEKKAGEEPGASAEEQAKGEEAEEPESPRQRRRRQQEAGFYVFSGVPAARMMDLEDPPTLLMQATFANSPLITLALMAWAIARASASVAGEIERGSLDLTLSRPVPRSTWLFAQVLATAAVFALLSLSIWAGYVTGARFFQMKNVPSPMAYLPSLLMVMGFGLAVYGYTLVFSSADLSRARVGIIGAGLSLGGIGAFVFTRQNDGYDWVNNLSVYNFYWPVGILADWSSEVSKGLMVLYGLFAAGVLIALAIFTRRDLPTSG